MDKLTAEERYKQETGKDALPFRFVSIDRPSGIIYYDFIEWLKSENERLEKERDAWKRRYELAEAAWGRSIHSPEYRDWQSEVAKQEGKK